MFTHDAVYIFVIENNYYIRFGVQVYSICAPPQRVRFLTGFYPSFESMVVGHCAETSEKRTKFNLIMFLPVQIWLRETYDISFTLSHPNDLCAIHDGL